jgi:hypothetical protein
MDIKTVNELFEEGIFSQLYKAGFISDKIFTYREIYLWVSAQMQTRGISKNKAAAEAELKFDKDRATIYRAFKSFSDCRKTLPQVKE